MISADAKGKQITRNKRSDCKKLIGWGGVIWVIFSLFFSLSPHN